MLKIPRKRAPLPLWVPAIESQTNAALCFDKLLAGLARRGGHCYDRKFRSPAPPAIWQRLRSFFFERFFDATVVVQRTKLWQTEPADAVRIMLVFKSRVRKVANAYELASDLRSEISGIAPVLVAIETMPLQEQFAALAATHMLICQTGTASLTLGVLMPTGAVLIEILQYVGRNQSVSMAGDFLWPSVPHLHVLYYEVRHAAVSVWLEMRLRVSLVSSGKPL